MPLKRQVHLLVSFLISAVGSQIKKLSSMLWNGLRFVIRFQVLDRFPTDPGIQVELQL